MLDLRDKEVSLVEFSQKHLDATYEWMQDPILRKNFLFFRNISKTGHYQWFKRLQTDVSQQIFAIEYKGEHVGNVGIKDIDYNARMAETWIYIGNKTHQNKGIASRAYSLLFFLIKNKTSLTRLYCYIANFNSDSERLYTKIGFKLLTEASVSKEISGETFVVNKYQIEI